jgi:hypothetical protein
MAQALVAFGFGVALQAPRKGGDDLGLAPRPVPRGPRTAKMKGQPKRAL